MTSGDVSPDADLAKTCEALASVRQRLRSTGVARFYADDTGPSMVQGHNLAVHRMLNAALGSARYIRWMDTRRAARGPPLLLSRGGASGRHSAAGGSSSSSSECAPLS